jgi:hypothetical protein
MSNVIQWGNNMLIVNGGNPIPDSDCPKSYEECDDIEKSLNKDTVKGVNWKFDCGFKLDFDGDLLKVSSRFYPPKTHYGEKWDGSCGIYLLNYLIDSKHFETDTLPELKEQVENYVRMFIKELEEDMGIGYKTTEGN